MASDPLRAFAPRCRLVPRSFEKPTPAQAKGWPPIAAGSTRSSSRRPARGKTLAAFLTAIDGLVRDPSERGTRVLYVSPLKALNHDVERNLRAPLHGIETPREVEVAVRSGDTPQRERAAMRRRPPDILITTPESLYLILTSAWRARCWPASIRSIVDEIHLAQPAANKTYTFGVQQTYSDGSVVNWSGRSRRTTPHRRSRRSRRSGGGGSSTSALVALVVGAIGVVLGVAALARRREARARVNRRARNGRGAVAAQQRCAARGCVGARGAASHRPVGERHGQRAAAASRAHLQRSGRAALRDRLRHRRGGTAARRPARRAGRQRTRTRCWSRSSTVAEGWYLVYWRAISVDGHPVRGAFTFAVGPNPGPAPQFPVPSISETAATPRLLTARWVVFLSRDGRDRSARAAHRDRAPARAARDGTSLRARVRSHSSSSAVVGLVAIPVYILRRDGGVRAAARSSTSARSCR